jgi:hypothetical protein
MTVSFSTLYARIGKLMGIAKAQIDARSALQDRVKGTGSFSGSGLDGQYDSSTRYMISGVLDYFLNLTRTADTSITNSIGGATKTVTEMVTADNGNIPKSAIPAFKELNRQMRAASTTLYQNVVTQGSVSYAAANVGTGKILLHGTPSQMSPSETITFQCISDTTTGATAGREVFQITGGLRVPDVTSNLWPGGSGANFTLASSDYNDSKNTLTNGGFDSFTGGVPDGWTIGSGAATLSQLSSGTFRNGSAIRHSGAAEAKFSQTSPSVVLGPGKRIIAGFWAKKVSGTVTTDIEMEVQNASTGTILAQVTAGAVTTSWQLYTASYQSDYNAPVEAITVEFVCNADVGVVKAIDCAFVFVPPQAGTNGQFVQIIGGDVDWRIGDYATVAISNNYQSNVLTYTERFFAPFANGIELPTASPGTITNSVIP